MKTKSILKEAGLFALALAGSTSLAIAGGTNYDFGDAPDPPYPTLMANDGARHDTADPSGPLLGTVRDFEPNGQPNLPATGDDMAPMPPDDEDGVFLISPLVPGSTARVRVVTSGTGPFCLNAWMDFNNDGDWADPGEQIFTDAVLGLGANILTFTVPPLADVTLRTYSRWRLNRAGGLSYTGAAADGEVEDYCHSPIHGQKWHDLNADGKRGPNEPGLNGTVIQLFDADGSTLIAQTTTHSLDHDGTPGINPITERGVYWMHAPAGFCILREQIDTRNAFQTFPAKCGAKEYFIHVQCEPLGRTPPDQPPVCGGVPNWLEDPACDPSPNPFAVDEMFSAAQLLLQTPPGAPFNGEILTLFANGPTFVNRFPPQNPGPGSAFIPTEMVEMDLVGHHPAIGRFHAQAGTGFGLPPLPPSQGEITEFGSTDELVVESFFDVFFEITVSDVGQTFRNNAPAQVVAEGGITEVPPVGSEYVEENVPLFNHPAGTPSGFEIIKLIHKPIYGLDFANKIHNAKKKRDLRRKCNQLRKKIRKARKKGQRAKARRLTRQWRRCLRQLRAL